VLGKAAAAEKEEEEEDEDQGGGKKMRKRGDSELGTAVTVWPSTHSRTWLCALLVEVRGGSTAPTTAQLPQAGFAPSWDNI